MIEFSAVTKRYPGGYEALKSVSLTVADGELVFINASVESQTLYALDKKTGKLLWKKNATTGVPRDKRHIKATYANATPA